ncbi:MAG: helix-turn-helix domain-containing protein [Eubacteriales bacterium]|nr:helix-turn-helix domain-containing protein [Eubacteriales bacterium]
MLSGTLLAKALQELVHITDAELLLTAHTGEVIADFSADLAQYLPNTQEFMQSSADNMIIDSVFFNKVFDEDRPRYALLTRGLHAEAISRIAVSELQNMLAVSHEKSDRNQFIQDVLLGNLQPSDIQLSARRMKIREEAERVVFLTETDIHTTDVAFRTLKALYSTAGSGTFLSVVDPAHIAITVEIDARSSVGFIEKTARTLADMLNMEAMIAVRIAYGTPKSSLLQLSQSYKEAQLAMQVGTIFTPDKYIFSYGSLGIGRLIYQLPPSLCELFMKETFDHDVFDELDEETMQLIRQFFSNNLNISETARQLYLHRNTLVYRMEKLEKTCGLDIRKFDDAMTFRIAMMVHDYLQHIEHTEKHL